MKVHYKVISGSMLPLIPIGAQLEVDTASKEYQVFDILLFKRDGHLVVHYLWRNQLKQFQTVITRSLENIYTDEAPVSRSHIIGLVLNYRISFFQRLLIASKCILTRKL